MSICSQVKLHKLQGNNWGTELDRTKACRVILRGELCVSF